MIHFCPELMKWRAEPSEVVLECEGILKSLAEKSLNSLLSCDVGVTDVRNA
jgi:hypothetical protein